MKLTEQELKARQEELQRKQRERIAEFHRTGIDPLTPKKPASEPSKGLGDTVAKAIKTATMGLVKPCGGCQKRREKLNQLFPYKDGDKQ